MSPTQIDSNRPSIMESHSAAAAAIMNDDENTNFVILEATTVQEIVTATQVIVVPDHDSNDNSHNYNHHFTQQEQHQQLLPPEPLLNLQHVDIDGEDNYEDTNDSTTASYNNYNNNDNNNNKEMTTINKSTTSSSLSSCSPFSIGIILSILLPIFYFTTWIVWVRHEIPPSGTWIHKDVGKNCIEQYTNALHHLELVLRHAWIELGCTSAVFVLHIVRWIGWSFTHGKNMNWNKDEENNNNNNNDNQDDDETGTVSNPSSSSPSSSSYLSSLLFPTSTLIMVLLLQVPMFMMAVLLAVCGYINNFQMENGPFTYPTETLKYFCSMDEMPVIFEIPQYCTYYVMTCVRIALSFGLWTSHGQHVYEFVSSYPQIRPILLLKQEQANDYDDSNDQEDDALKHIDNDNNAYPNIPMVSSWSWWFPPYPHQSNVDVDNNDNTTTTINEENLVKQSQELQVMIRTIQCRIYSSMMISMIIFLLSIISLFTILRPAVQELEAMDPR